jgi:hypothetical protein
MSKELSSRARVQPSQDRTSIADAIAGLPIAHLNLDESGRPDDKESPFERWGDPEIMRSGYVIVPSLFVRNYSRLKPAITTEEAMFILVVMTFKWGKSPPFPSYKTIASAMGVSDKMCRRYAQRLEAKGYLRRIGRTYQTNEFDFRGLSNALYRINAGLKQDGIMQKGLDVIKH